MAAKGQVIPTKTDAEHPFEWQQRGTVLGVLISVGSTSVSHVIYLLAMFTMIKTNYDKLLKCRAGHEGLHFVSAYVCDYTKAYVECFPELALTVCLLVIGRNLLQTRFYYGLLENEAVVQFKSKDFFRDGLVRLFLWCYLHCIAHLCLILWLIHSGGMDDTFIKELKDTGGGRKSKFLGYPPQFLAVDQASHPLRDTESNLPHMINLLVHLVGFFVIPATLFLVYLLFSYDIELTLVPLSQYFHDARKAMRQAQYESSRRSRRAKREIERQSKRDLAADSPREEALPDAVDDDVDDDVEDVLVWDSALVSLSVMDDDALRLMVENHQAEILKDDDPATGVYDKIKKMYNTGLGRKYEAEARANGAEFIGLSYALWPARVLVSHVAADTLSWATFRMVWVIFVAIALVGQCIMATSVVSLIPIDIADYRHGDHGHALVHLAVVIGNLLVQIWGIWVIAGTVGQWLLHDRHFRREAAAMEP